MDMRYEAYSYADPLFYDSPVRWATLEEFPAAVEPAPAGWTRNAREVWVGFQPVDLRLPEQGWKIHVSACMDNAPRILDVVRTHCFAHRVAFKFLRSPALVQTQNAKYAPRGSSGKFMTLYPVGDDALERCLTDLDASLAGEPGPYILSDLRWREGPLYLRYGGFVEQFCRTETGELVLAFREPSGALRPDVRRAVFEVPEWAPVPAVLAPALADPARTGPGDFPYAVERALHFSNGGGIYLGRHNDGGPQVVLKEARPHAGLDQRGEDAVRRLGREHDVLRRLSGLDAVPDALGYLTTWEHHFLVQEYVEGEPLHRWFGLNYPLVHPEADDAAVEDYRAAALRILDGVTEGLRAIHDRGIVFGDLHPRNLIVRPDGSIAFVDFELASPVDEFLRPALGAAGFAAPPGLTGFAVDEHALAAIRLWLFLPLMPLTVLSPGKAGALVHAARQRFGLSPHLLPDPPAPRDASAASTSGSSTPGAVGAPGHAFEELLDGGPDSWPRLRAELTAAITAAATPDRTDRLFPGDPGQFTHDGLGLSYGAAGVLWALHTTGAEIDPDHVRWLTAAVHREPCRSGLFIGAHGVAYVLDLLGRRTEALDLLERLGKDDADGLGPDLAGGLAGVGLTLRHFAQATGDRALHEAAVDAAERAVTKLGLHLPDGAATGAGPATAARTGLLHGPTGAALLLLHLYEDSGDTALLDLARRALDRDLARCVLAEDGTLQVDDGTRVLPYLESGSAGIAAVLHSYLRHRPDAELAERLEQIRGAARPEFIVQSGLFNGRAGLIALLRQAQGGGTAHAETIRRHIRRLAWHAIPYQGHLAFPGEQLLRLSMDLATGSAGVLTALGAVFADTPALPFWPGAAGPDGPRANLA
ncbi:class III lanthionine synthetase LanKC [Kitasatospora sp. NPDC097691]|uniref:class III lanthionine synthetase LanKC n=1 Tax=Kitasatospora sp. NPDC097691 TaxID=3157231 RepID=UPI00331EFA54